VSEVMENQQQGLAGKYRPYPEYKDSGVEWMGQIPTHWMLRKTFHAGISIRTGKVDVNIQNESGDYPFFTCSREAKKANQYSFDCEALLVAGNGDVGFTQYYNGKFEAYQRTYVISKFSDYDVQFLRYHFENNLVTAVENKSIGSVIQFITLGDLRHFPLPTPPDFEQQTIAAFLDYETARIDRLIAQQQRLIELLKEKRQAVISHAVTKGLNPAASMKDSGVEWLGQVPEHWDVVRSKTVFNDQDNRSVSGDEELLTVSHLTGVTLRSEKDVNMFQAESLVGYKLCEKEDFVVNTMWAWMGAMGVSFTSGIVSPSYNVYRVNKSCLHASYLELLCRTPEFVSVVTSRSKGIWSSRLRIYPESLYEIRLSLPPLNEQKNIVKYVTQQTGNYAYLIDKADKGIRLMQERRTALISAAVTGKIDLRGWTPPVEGVAV